MDLNCRLNVDLPISYVEVFQLIAKITFNEFKEAGLVAQENIGVLH